jgi:hypothetical protein
MIPMQAMVSASVRSGFVPGCRASSCAQISLHARQAASIPHRACATRDLISPYDTWTDVDPHLPGPEGTLPARDAPRLICVYLRSSAARLMRFCFPLQRPLPNQPATQCRLIQFVNRCRLRSRRLAVRVLSESRNACTCDRTGSGISATI